MVYRLPFSIRRFFGAIFFVFLFHSTSAQPKVLSVTELYKKIVMGDKIALVIWWDSGMLPFAKSMGEGLLQLDQDLKDKMDIYLTYVGKRSDYDKFVSDFNRKAEVNIPESFLYAFNETMEGKGSKSVTKEFPEYGRYSTSGLMLDPISGARTLVSLTNAKEVLEAILAYRKKMPAGTRKEPRPMNSPAVFKTVSQLVNVLKIPLDQMGDSLRHWGYVDADDKKNLRRYSMKDVNFYDFRSFFMQNGKELLLTIGVKDKKIVYVSHSLTQEDYLIMDADLTSNGYQKVAAKVKDDRYDYDEFVYRWTNTKIPYKFVLDKRRTGQIYKLQFSGCHGIEVFHNELVHETDKLSFH